MNARQTVHTLLWLKRHVMREFRTPGIETIGRWIRPGDVCLDVGAHAGSWTMALSKRVPDGHVYAFEALPYYAEVLGATMRTLRRRNVTVVNRAVNQDGSAVDLVWKDAEGSRLTGRTHIASGGESRGDRVHVPGVALDTFCEQHSVTNVRFVKCDVEGAELSVVEGARRMIGAWRPVFLCEVEPEHCRRYGTDPAELHRAFRELDYRPHSPGAPGQGAPDAKGRFIGGNDVLFIPSELEKVARSD